MRPFNVNLQSTSIDLLQSLVVRGEIDVVTLQTIESAVVSKLYFSVHTHRLDLQNKLLHLLHAIITALISQAGASQPPPPPSSTPEIPQVTTPSSYNLNPLLVQTLIDGLSVSSNHPILQHWLDFILSTVPHLPNALHTVIIPLNDCLCKLLRSSLADVQQASKGSIADDIISSTTDADFLMLLTALERLVLLSSSQMPVATQEEEEATSPEKHESSGLLGYVSNVFSSDSASAINEEQTSVRSILNNIIDVCSYFLSRNYQIIEVYMTLFVSSTRCGMRWLQRRLRIGPRRRNRSL